MKEVTVTLNKNVKTKRQLMIKELLSMQENIKGQEAKSLTAKDDLEIKRLYKKYDEKMSQFKKCYKYNPFAGFILSKLIDRGFERTDKEDKMSK